MKTDQTKRLCDECGWRGHDIEVVKAANPFDIEDVVVGCPKCRSVNAIKMVCDEQGCWEPSSCGETSEEGYRHICGSHTEWAKARIVTVTATESTEAKL